MLVNNRKRKRSLFQLVKCENHCLEFCAFLNMRHMPGVSVANDISGSGCLNTCCQGRCENSFKIYIAGKVAVENINKMLVNIVIHRESLCIND